MQKIERAGIVFAIVTSVVGVAVSLVSLLISLEANRLTGKQIELALYGGEPVFDVQWEIGKDGLPYYIVKNTGANIHSVGYSVESELSGTFTVESNEPQASNMGCYRIVMPRTNRFLLIEEPRKVYRVEEIDFDTPFDESSQSLRFSAYRKFQSETAVPDDIGKLAEDILGPVWAWSFRITIAYSNYRNEPSTRTIDILGVGETEDSEARFGDFMVRTMSDEDLQEESDLRKENEAALALEIPLLKLELWSGEDPRTTIEEALAAHLSRYNLTLT